VKRFTPDKVATWTSLLPYFAVWQGLTLYALGRAHWYVGTIWATAYVAGQAVSIKKVGHSHLSADPTALGFAVPAAFATCILLAVTGAISGVRGWIGVFAAFGASFMGGHVAAVVWSALVTAIAAFVLPKSE